ncbi:MAG: hypothetical protein FJ148_03225 [Deltaproteobacteria bacterium]|nr:hypothetical protein [Deltaproteobacteria bacterium]
MRWVVVTLLAGLLALSGSVASAKDKVPCKKVKEAIAAGKTRDQVAQELGTRVERVDKCMHKKAKADASGPTGAAVSADDEDAED